MAFYRDSDGDIWLTSLAPKVVYCITETEDEGEEDDFSIGIAVSRLEAEKAYGPLTEVVPTGWKEV